MMAIWGDDHYYRTGSLGVSPCSWANTHTVRSCPRDALSASPFGIHAKTSVIATTGQPERIELGFHQALFCPAVSLRTPAPVRATLRRPCPPFTRPPATQGLGDRDHSNRAQRPRPNGHHVDKAHRTWGRQSGSPGHPSPFINVPSPPSAQGSRSLSPGCRFVDSSADLMPTSTESQPGTDFNN
jgi:hypothetical protein